MNQRLMVAILGAGLSMTVAGLPGLAQAEDPALDAALEADEVNQEHCANLYSSKVDTAASSTMRVAESWQRVSEVYESSKAPYLLYWRGTLAQCLGRDESATADLTSFVEQQGTSTMFSNLVRNAQTRLRRLGAGVVGKGEAAAYLRRGDQVEGTLRLAAGGGVTMLSCLDEGEGRIAVNNSACSPGPSPQPAFGAAIQGFGLDAGIDVFPTRGFGLGGRLLFDMGVPTDTPDRRSPGPHIELQAGPQLRLLNSVASGGRAGWFRATVRFAAAFGQISPWAGAPKYLADLGTFHDAGSWELRHVGPAASIGGAFEVGHRIAISIEGRFSFFVPTGANGTRQVQAGRPVDVRVGTGETADPDDDVIRPERIPDEYVPDAIGTSRYQGGLHVTVLTPIERRGVAVGPFIDFGFRQTSVRFPGAPEDLWCAVGYSSDGASLCVGDGDERKVFSTRRDDLLLRAGVELRFGKAAPPAKEPATPTEP